MTKNVSKTEKVSPDVIKSLIADLTSINPRNNIGELDGLTKYIILKCLTDNISKLPDIGNLISNLKGTPTYESFLSKKDQKIRNSTEPEGYLGTERFFDSIFNSNQKYNFVGRKSIIKDIDRFAKTGRIDSKDTKSNVLLILGEPGTGKTSLMREYLKDKRNKFAHYFIEPKSRDLTNPKLFIKHMDSFLRKKHELPFTNYGGETVEMLDRLIKLFHDITDSKLKHSEEEVVFVDGLDNCPKATTSIASILTDIMQNDFKNKVKVVLSSRETQYISHLKSLCQHNLILLSGNKDNTKDITAFLQANIKKEIPELIKSKIINKTEGNFLCANLWVEQSINLEPKELEDAIEKFPTGLDGIYDLMINILEVNKTQEERVMIRDALRIIAIAKEKLTPKKILGFCNIDDYDKERVIGSIEQFFDITEYKSNNRCKYHHLYFEEYIINKMRNEKEYHSKIVNYYETFYNKKWATLDDDYAFDWLSYHYLSAGLDEKVMQLLEVGFLQSKQRIKGFCTKLLPDIATGIQASLNLGTLSEVFKYAMIHTILKKQQTSKLRVSLIPLYARLGKINVSIEMADSIESPIERAVAYARIANNSAKRMPEISKSFMEKSVALIDKFPNDKNNHIQMLTIAKEICLVDLKQTMLVIRKIEQKSFEKWDTFIVISEKLMNADPKKCIRFLEWIKNKYDSDIIEIMQDLLPSILELEPQIAFKIIDKIRFIEVPTFYKISLDKIRTKPEKWICNFAISLIKTSILAKWESSEARKLFQFLADTIAKSNGSGVSKSLFQMFNNPFFCDELRVSLLNDYSKNNCKDLDSTFKQIEHPYFIIKAQLFLFENGKIEIDSSTITSYLYKIKEDYFKTAAIELILNNVKSTDKWLNGSLRSDVFSYAEEQGLLLQTLSEYSDLDIEFSLPIIERVCIKKILARRYDNYMSKALQRVITQILTLKKNKKYKERVLNIFDMINKEFNGNDMNDNREIWKIGIQLARLDWKRAWGWIELINDGLGKADFYAAIVQGMKTKKYSLTNLKNIHEEVFSCISCERIDLNVAKHIINKYIQAVADVSHQEALGLIESLTDTVLRGELYQTVAKVICKKDILLGLEIAKKDKGSHGFGYLLPSELDINDDSSVYIKQVKGTIEQLCSTEMEESEKENIISDIIVEVAININVEDAIDLIKQYLPREKLFPFYSLFFAERSSSFKTCKNIENVIRDLINLDPSKFVSEISSEYLNLRKGIIPRIMIEEVVQFEDDKVRNLSDDIISLFIHDNLAFEQNGKMCSAISEQLMNVILTYYPNHVKEFIVGLPSGSVRLEGLVLLARKTASEGRISEALDYMDLEMLEVSDSINILEAIIDSAPSKIKFLEQVHKVIEKKYKDVEDKYNSLIRLLATKYITINKEKSIFLIHKLPIYERMTAYFDTIRACPKSNKQIIEELLLEATEKARQLFNNNIDYHLLSYILVRFASLCTEEIQDQKKRNTFFNEYLEIASNIEDFDVKQDTITSITSELIQVNLDKSLEVLKQLDQSHKAKVLEGLVSVDPNKTLSLLDSFLSLGKYGSRIPLFLDIKFIGVFNSLIEDGKFSVEKLLEIKERYTRDVFASDPVKKAVEQMVSENRPLEEIIDVIVNYGTSELFTIITPKLLSEYSLDKLFDKIDSLKSQIEDFTEKIYNELITNIVYKYAEQNPKDAIERIDLLPLPDQSGLYLQIAKNLWSKDEKIASKLLLKSEELSTDYFNLFIDSDLSEILKFKLECLNSRSEIMDIISVAVAYGDTFEQITEKVISTTARLGEYDDLKKLSNAVISADQFVKEL